VPERTPLIHFGREVTGDLELAARREWLCADGLGGFASGTVAGALTRRYHGLLVAALAPPLGRTLVAVKVDETVTYGGVSRALGVNAWASGAVEPRGHRHLIRFALEGTTPVWTYACADALLERRVFMEPGASTTYVQWRVRRAQAPLTLEAALLVDYRDYHGVTHGGWPMRVETVPKGIRVTAFEGARPLLVLADEAAIQPTPEWYYAFELARERERGLEDLEDHLRAGVLRATVPPGGQVTLVLSTEQAPALDGNLARARREAWEGDLLARWRRARPAAAKAPAWIRQLVLAADQFVVHRPLAGDPDGMSVIAGYHWFGDWGRDTMIALPGLTLVTGRPEVARRILTTYARFVDRGMLPNRFPDAGEAPEYNTADATLWYVEAVRAYHAATGDDVLVRELYPTLDAIVAAHRAGTRHGIGEDPADGLLHAGEPGVQVTWMDARVGDRVVTPRIGKPVEINALWYNALRTMAGFAILTGRPAQPWRDLADRVERSFARFWCERTGGCHDVLDGPDGDDASIRPNQLFAVALPASPLPSDRQRRVVETVARHLLTPVGLRSLAPEDPAYCGRYGGGVTERDCAYHQGAVWAWLLGPFALAWRRVFGDATAARELLAPLADHLAEYGLGSIAEVFDGDPPHAPGGCIAQAWSVAETLRAWHELAETE
jgi:predicted glycogen debranching enzyme